MAIESVEERTSETLESVVSEDWKPMPEKIC
jgi:hypothetical protein